MIIILRTFLHFLNSRSNSLYWAYILKWYIFKNNLSVAISKYTLKYNMCRPGSNWYKISSIRITQSVFRKRTFMSRKLLVWRHISNPCCYRDLLHSVLGDDIHVGLSKWWELLWGGDGRRKKWGGEEMDDWKYGKGVEMCGEGHAKPHTPPQGVFGTFPKTTFPAGIRNSYWDEHF